MFAVVIALMMIVVVPVFIGLPLVLWRYRLGNQKAAYRPDWSLSGPLEFAIWGIPVLIVAALSWQLWLGTHRLDPYKRFAGDNPLEVQAISLDWKWLFIYPGQDIATVNRLVIPVDQPVHIDLTSDTVMQSLMIPSLAGQIYAMAGMRTQLNLVANRQGRFLGENTQYNGEGFQKQSFPADVMSPARFQEWAAQVRATAPPLDAARYAQLTRRAAQDKPLAFGSVEPGLFAKVINHYRADGSGWAQGAKQ